MGDLSVFLAALFVSAAGLNALANWLEVPYPIPLVLGGLVLALIPGIPDVRLNPDLVLWWVPAGALPTVEDAESRLAALEEHGPTPYAFTFKRPFSPVGVEAVPGLSAELSLCD